MRLREEDRKRLQREREEKEEMRQLLMRQMEEKKRRDAQAKAHTNEQAVLWSRDK